MPSPANPSESAPSIPTATTNPPAHPKDPPENKETPGPITGPKVSYVLRHHTGPDPEFQPLARPGGWPGTCHPIHSEGTGHRQTGDHESSSLAPRRCVRGRPRLIAPSGCQVLVTNEYRSRNRRSLETLRTMPRQPRSTVATPVASTNSIPAAPWPRPGRRRRGRRAPSDGCSSAEGRWSRVQPLSGRGHHVALPAERPLAWRVMSQAPLAAATVALRPECHTKQALTGQAS